MSYWTCLFLSEPARRVLTLKLPELGIHIATKTTRTDNMNLRRDRETEWHSKVLHTRSWTLESKYGSFCTPSCLHTQPRRRAGFSDIRPRCRDNSEERNLFAHTNSVIIFFRLARDGDSKLHTGGHRIITCSQQLVSPLQAVVASTVLR